MNNKKNPALIVLICLLFSISILSALFYRRDAEESAREQAYEQLSDLAHEQAATLMSRVDSQFSMLSASAKFIGASVNLRESDISEYLRTIISNTYFLNIGYVNAKGEGILQNGSKVNVADRDYYIAAMKGNRMFTKVETAKLSKEPRFIQSVPIIFDGKVEGLLFGSYNESMLKELLTTNAFSGNAVTYLCDSKGDIIIGSNSKSFLFGEGNILYGYDNIIDGYSLSKDATEENREKLRSGLKQGKSGIFRFEYQGEIRNITYDPLGINDWFIINGIPESLVIDSIKKTTGTALVLLLVIICFAAMTMLFVVWQQRRNVRAVRAEQKKLRISEEEYRIAAQQSNKYIARYDVKTQILYMHEAAAKAFGVGLVLRNIPNKAVFTGIVAPESVEEYKNFFKKMQQGEDSGFADCKTKTRQDNEYRWYHGNFTMVRDENGTPIHAVISFYDNTAEREHELAYELWRQSVSMLPAETTAIYEYNLTNDVQEAVSGGLMLARDKSRQMNLDQRSSYWAENYVHPADTEKFVAFLSRSRLLSSFYSENTEQSMEFRAFINDRIKSFRWLRITVRMAQYPATDEIKGFLIFEDINDRKTEELSVRKRLETDALTGVLNRSTFFAKVTELLQELPANKHAIVMVDLDNFKHINDTLGHVVGDELLLRVASEIKSVLRSGDLIGRIGGDEFMICLKNIPFLEAIEKRADFICKMMHLEVADGIKISGSCGVALYPRHGKSFQELYQCADIAAYRAKQNGRNRYEVYSPSMEGNNPVLSSTPIDILNTGEGVERDYSGQIQEVVFNSEKLSVADAISNYITAGIIIFEVQEDRLNTLYISPPYLSLEKNAKLSRVGGDALANVHPEDRARLFENVKRCIASGEVCEDIYRSNPEIGQYWLKGRTALIPYEDSEYPVLICVETDISEFIYQQEMLKKANDVLQTVDTVVGVFKMSLDQQLMVTFCNRRLIEIQGNTFGEKYAYGLKISASEYITENSRQELLNTIAQAQQEEKDYIELEIQLVTENRADKWVFVWGLLAHDTDGQQCLNGCVLDITESRAKIRNKVTEDVGQGYDTKISEYSHAQLRFIHEMSAIETFEVDIKTRTLSLSGGTLSKYAIDESKITNVPESMIERGTVHQDSAGVYRRLYEDIFAGKPEGDCIIKARRKTGQFALIRIVYRCLYDENGEAVKAVGISEQLENIADSRLRFEQEEKLNKLIRYDLIVFAKINLSTNRIEESQMPSQTGYTNDFYTDYSEAYTNLSNNIPNAEERAEYSMVFSREALKASFSAGEDWIYRELRVCRADGSIQWTSHEVQLLASPLTGDIYAFIYIRNINDRKVQELSLSSTAEFDSTRTFYTRSTLQAIVASAISRSRDEQVMMGIAIIKVHNLGEIIERFGSACIDRLMLSINRKLRYSIENCYVTARTANNDVVLFFNGVESRAQIMELGEYIMFILRNPSFYTTITEQYAIYQTGAAVFRAKDADFDKLYRHALVSADKADIFKPYILYDDDSESYGDESEVRLVPGAEETMLDNAASLFSDSQTDDATISKVAKIIFTGQNTEQTINQVLSLVGNIYGAERAYILEVDNENQALNNTYEWCASGVTPEKANLQQVPFTAIPTFYRAFKTNKAIVIEDVNALSEGNSEFNILKEQRIKSLCVSPYSVDDRVLGFLGIDNASLMKDNISLLNTISFFLMGELFKRRTIENERYMSRSDLLSGALSRNSYVEYIKAINVDSLTSMGVVMVNVSGLKELNKKFGNIYGDEVLKSAAQTIQEYFGKDCVFRYGGGTFVAMMQNLSCERFTQRVKELQTAFDKNLNYDVSVGHTWSDSVESVEKLVAEADMLMTYARREQNARQEKRKSAQTDSVVKELLAAIEKGYCKMYLQPKANTSDMSVCGAEALVRIITPQHGIVYPGRFIPLLEDVGAVRYIDFFMLEQVFKLLDEWKKGGQPLMQISLNFSRSTLMEPGVVEAMLEIAEKYDVPREYVEIEITESFGDLQWETMRHIGSSIIRAGFKLSLDDFGAKYSNLSILASVPFSTIKLDKSLVDRIVSNTMSFFLVKSVVELCNTFNANVVAEGVETQAQLEKLREMGCPCMQGYLLNKPLSVAEFESKYH